ncbi:Ankyrin-1 [Branchiostoma belcheri]|nr:Ankyrin-1 [Branchiostoma belcheri]
MFGCYRHRASCQIPDWSSIKIRTPRGEKTATRAQAVPTTTPVLSDGMAENANEDLLYAAQNDYLQGVKDALEAGADIDYEDDEITAVLHASINGHVDIATLLIRKEASVSKFEENQADVISTLKLCGRCKLTRYCSRDCQKQHWTVGHKRSCGHDALKATQQALCGKVGGIWRSAGSTIQPPLRFQYIHENPKHFQLTKSRSWRPPP